MASKIQRFAATSETVIHLAESRTQRWRHELALCECYHDALGLAFRIIREVEAEERAVLQPLAERPYRPLVLPEARRQRRTLVRPLTPEVLVERRGLQHYQALVAADAGEVGV